MSEKTAESAVAADAKHHDLATFEAHLDHALERTEGLLEAFPEDFPAADTGPDLRYDHWPVEDWTPSFWTGLCWLAYELTGEEAYRDLASDHLDAFEERIEGQVEVDADEYDGMHTQGVMTHDLGFLYSLSAVAQYRVTGAQRARQVGLRAADVLAGRFHEFEDGGGVIQAFADPRDEGSEHYGRTISDCMMNLPLLFWAAQETGYDRYHDIAAAHARSTAWLVVQDDGNTHRGHALDPETGTGTAIEYDDGIPWSRGHAWTVYGLPLAYRYTKETELFEASRAVADYYLDNVPEDLVPRNDLPGNPSHGRDTSAAAIAACGLLELASHCPAADPDRERYISAGLETLDALGEHFSVDDPDAHALLTESSYSDDPTEQSDNATIFGDYYYVEGLVRATTDWDPYW